MTFLSSAMLPALGALAVPIIIHLWQQRRVREVPFSTLRFLRVVAAKTTRSAKLEHLLLLLLRGTIIALVALAAARPVVSNVGEALFGGKAPRVVALVIDESLSMGYKVGEQTRLQTAVEQARLVMDSLKPGDAVAVIGASDHSRVLIAEPTVDLAAARKALDGIRQGEGSTDFAGPLKDAAKALSKVSRGIRQVYLFTDGQASGWQFDPALVFGEEWKKNDVRLLVVRTDGSKGANAAIAGIQFETPFASAGAVLRGVATVANYSELPLQDLLEIRVGEERLVQRSVDAPPGGRVSVPFEFQVPLGTSGRSVRGVASLAGDGLPGDDRHYFSLPLAQVPKILLVETGGGPERDRAGFFLRKALAAGNAQAPVKTVSPAELDGLNVDSYSAVFLLGLPSLSDRASVRLERYMDSGGTVAVFVGDAFRSELWERVDWLPGTPRGVKDLPAERQPSLMLEPQHPLFASWDVATPFPSVSQKRVLHWEPRKGARALISIGQGIPYMMYASRGSGHVVVVNTSADLAWGGFPISPAFLPVVYEVGRLSVARAGKLKPVRIGEPVPLPVGLNRDSKVSLRLPSGDVLPVGAGGLLLEEAERSGFYEVSTSEDGVIAEFSVNVDGAEGNMTVESPEELHKRVPHEMVTGLDELRQWLEASRGLVPVWPLLLVLAVVMFVIETVYSNLLARNRAQGEAEHVSTGRLNRRRFGQRRQADAAVVEGGAV